MQDLNKSETSKVIRVMPVLVYTSLEKGNEATTLSTSSEANHIKYDADEDKIHQID